MKNKKGKARKWKDGNKQIVVLYHDDPDGFGAAWAVWKKLKDKARYVAVNFNQPMSKNLKNKKLIFVDFCYEEPVMRKLEKEAKEITVIDHHVSAKELVKSFQNNLFADNHSGCVLAWKYFHPKKKIPKLLQYVEDMDIWKWKMPNAWEAIASLEIRDFDFDVWDKMIKDFETAKGRKKYLQEGEAILKYRTKIIKEMVGRAEKISLDGKKAFAVNSPNLHSEIGHEIYKKHKVIGVIWSYKNDRIKVSLRSGKEDVSEIAQKHGGGGHKLASGFSFPAKINPTTKSCEVKFPWKKRK
jgi:oligoribonuclease NrnB/cAMP/cGMP phosphodiesterase (DHH superfamily)